MVSFWLKADDDHSAYPTSSAEFIFSEGAKLVYMDDPRDWGITLTAQGGFSLMILVCFV